MQKSFGTNMFTYLVGWLERWICGTALAFGLSNVACAQTELERLKEPPFLIEKISENIYAAIAKDQGRIGSNAGFVIGEGAVLVIDSFDTNEAATSLLEAIRRITPSPIKYVVNTHYHLDHVGGNSVFAKEGAVVIARHGVRARMGENIKFFGPNPAPEIRKTINALNSPSMLFESAMTIYLGSREVQLRPYPGHTGSDTVVFVPDAKVAFAGDLVWCETVPNLVDADVSNWLATLDILQSDPTFSAGKFVPGHGRVASKADLYALSEYFTTLRKEIAKGYAQGLRGESLVDTVLESMPATYRGWKYAAYFSRANIRNLEVAMQAGTSQSQTKN